MRKKAVLIISILLVICIGIISFSGCFLFKKDTPKEIIKIKTRHDTLELTQVYQLISGDVVLDIKNINSIRYADEVEYTLNDGEDWHIAKRDIQQEYFYFNIQESDYGNQYDIAARIAEDEDNLEGRKSNTITFSVKAPNKIKEENINGFFATIIKKPPKEGDYKFVCEDERVVLKRYYEEENGDIVLKPVANDDRISVLYLILANDIIDDGNIDAGKHIIEFFKLQDMLKDENDFFDLAKTITVFSEYLTIKGNTELDIFEWKNYDYDNGISKDEYDQSIVAGFDFENDYIIRTGELFFMLVIVDEDDTNLMSDTFIIKCWV